MDQIHVWPMWRDVRGDVGSSGFAAVVILYLVYVRVMGITARTGGLENIEKVASSWTSIRCGKFDAHSKIGNPRNNES